MKSTNLALIVFSCLLCIDVTLHIHRFFEAAAQQQQRVSPTPKQEIITDAPPMKCPIVEEASNRGLIEPTNAIQQELWKLASTPNLPTLVSIARIVLTNLLAYEVLKNNIPGDFVETGVFTGGACIVMYKILQAYGNGGRKLYAFDSFEGLPEPVEKDKIGSLIAGEKKWFSAGLDIFINNMKKFDAFDNKTVIPIKGWFNETLPNAPVERISFLRLDGDLVYF